MHTHGRSPRALPTRPRTTLYAAAAAIGTPATMAVGVLAAAVTLIGCAQGATNRRDAALGTPDTGSSGLPDTGLDAPFARIDAGSPPDAVVLAPDAFLGLDAPGADAFAAMPDAFAGTDAFARDAFARDAFMGTDASSACSDSPCRLLTPQCGCASGQSCYPMGATRVCAVTGTRPEGNGCAGVSDCMPGLGCVNFSSDAAMPGNMCSRICATDADCASGALCVHTIGDGLGGTVPGLRFCSRNCTPAPNAGCAPGLACTLFQERVAPMRIFTDCAGPVGAGRQGSPCVDETDCAGGFGCFDTGFGNECVSWCRVTAPSCPLGTTCQSVGIAGGVEWGVCA